jgi:hypothetical protein
MVRKAVFQGCLKGLSFILIVQVTSTKCTQNLNTPVVKVIQVDFGRSLQPVAFMSNP